MQGPFEVIGVHSLENKAHSLGDFLPNIISPHIQLVEFLYSGIFTFEFF